MSRSAIHRQSGSRLGIRARRIKFSIGARLGRYPRLYLPLVALRQPGRQLIVREDTDLVIEGFPRSANSFVLCAFEMAQVHPVKVAHHVHAAANVLWAARRSKPILLLIRDPVDAAVSLVVRLPYLSVRDALDAYVRMYRPLLEYRDSLIIADFAEVTTDLGQVIRRVNRRFDTRFEPFLHTEKNVARCFAVLDDWARRTEPAGAIDLVGFRPAGARESVSRKIRDVQMRGRAVSIVERQARDIYAAVLDGAR
jgi:hypothetical protein